MRQGFLGCIIWARRRSHFYCPVFSTPFPKGHYEFGQQLASRGFVWPSIVLRLISEFLEESRYRRSFQ